MNISILKLFHYPQDSKPLSKEAEIAILLGLSLSNRKRISLLSGDMEEIEYISSFYYPLIGFQWQNKSLLFSMVSNNDFEINYDKIINLDKLFSDVKINSNIRKDYIRFIMNKANSINHLFKKKKIHIGPIIFNNNLSETIIRNSHEIPSPENISGISLPYNEDWKTLITNYENNFKTIQNDIENLRYIIQILSQELDKHTTKAELEIQLIEERIGEELKKTIGLVKKNIRKIENVTESTKLKEERKYNRENTKLLKLHRKYENELYRLNSQEIILQNKINLMKKKNKKSELYLINKRLKKLGMNIRINKQRIKENENLSKLITKKFQDRIQEIDIFSTKDIEIERRKILIIEKSRNDAIRNIKDQITILEKNTTKIIDYIYSRIDVKINELDNFKDLSIPIQLEYPKIFYVQLYLIKYLKKTKTRFEIISPILFDISRSRLSSFSIGFGRVNRKLSDLIKPFSKQLSSFILKDINDMIYSNNDFVSFIDEKSKTHNLLNKISLLKELKKDLFELSKKNILSNEEANRIIRNYGKDLNE